MAGLRITRKDEIFNRGRSVSVYLNGIKIGTVDTNETKEFAEIPAGSYKLQCKIDWCGSQELPFSIDDNQSKSVEVSAYKYSGTIALIVIATLVAYLLLRRTSIGPYAYWVLLPTFLAFTLQCYYFTFGRNDYLVLKELN